MKIYRFIGTLFLSLLMTGCDGNQSLQEYYVENQENKDFLALDIPASLMANTESLNDDQRKTLESIKKINLLAIPQKPENLQTIEIEKNKIASILSDEEYQLLMKFGSGETRLELYYTGKEDAVNEVIVYGFNEEKGLGIARILGKNMNPGEIMGLIKSLEKGDLNIDGLKSVSSMFVETEK